MDDRLIYFHKGFDDDGLLKFQLNIHSDIGELAQKVGCNSAFITTRHTPHVFLGAAVLKGFTFSLDTEEGETAADCAAFFVNSELAQRRIILSSKELAPKQNPQVVDAIFDDRTTKWLMDGTNFVHIPCIRISAAYKGNNFIPWLVKTVPSILSAVYSLSFQKIVVSFPIGMADGDFEWHPELLEDELGCRRLVNHKRTLLREIMESLGYEEMKDTDMDKAVFCRDS